MPRDRVSSDLSGASSVAIVSMALAERIARRHSVRVVASRGADQASFERFEPGIDCRRVPITLSKLHKYRELAASVFERVPGHFLSRAYFVDYYLRAAAALRDFDPDVIHIQNYGQCALIFRRQFPRARIVVHAHDTVPARVDSQGVHRILGSADLVVTCSDYVARAIRSAHPGLDMPVEAINNGVDIRQFVPRDDREGTASEETLRLLYLGRLSPEKGVHVLMEAFNLAAARNSGLRLDLIGAPAMFAYAVVKLFRADPHWAAIRHFYGETPSQRFLRQFREPGRQYEASLHRAMTPQAASMTRFLGELPHSEVAARIAAADILVVPSVCDEPFGIPVVEAMAAGIPVVASAAGGINDIVADGVTGLLVPRSDPTALAAALLELAADPARRRAMGQAGRIRVQQEFSWESSFARLSSALDRIGVRL